jgi:deoxyribonuclease-4
MQPIRCRKILSALTTTERTALRKLLPKGVAASKEIKELEAAKYPTGVVNALIGDEGYATMGRIVEEFLHMPVEEINMDTLIVLVGKYDGTFGTDIDKARAAKIRKSKTTEPFLDKIRVSRILLEKKLVRPVEFEPQIQAGHVEGHPDIRSISGKQVFEIKFAARPAVDWTDYMFQLFTYAAIGAATGKPAATVYLVLPLQEYIWEFDVADWNKKQAAAYLAFMEAKSVRMQTVEVAMRGQVDELCCRCGIGSHIGKRGSFCDSISHIVDGSRAWQLFLSSTQSSNCTVKDEDIAATRAHIDATGARIFIHSPYIINLASIPGMQDDYHTGLLKKQLGYAARMGCKGVVVHVGKSTHQDAAVAAANMKANVLACLEAATVECPLLLETPAGQGTEMLRTWDEFVGFVREFDDPRLRICADTCHIFACGADPLEYIKRLETEAPGYLKLIHFNDSVGDLGSCVDRHAMAGLGKIGIEKMTAIAELAAAAGIATLIE